MIGLFKSIADWFADRTPNPDWPPQPEFYDVVEYKGYAITRASPGDDRGSWKWVTRRDYGFASTYTECLLLIDEWNAAGVSTEPL